MVVSVDCVFVMYVGVDRLVLFEVGVVIVDVGSIGVFFLLDFVGGVVGFDVVVESGRVVVGWVVSVYGFDYILFDKGVVSLVVKGEIGLVVVGNIEGVGVVEEFEWFVSFLLFVNIWYDLFIC